MIFTVGHGRRSAAELIALLQEASIERLVDVRAFPFSRRHPQFSREPLGHALAAAAIAYDWQGRALGGYRKGGYAQHMASGEFQQAAAALPEDPLRSCLMCAESNPEQCHRWHISDWLVAHGHDVVHLLAPGERRPHPTQLL